MAAPRKNEIYDAVIRRMVAEELERQEAEFTLVHKGDTDEALTEYLLQWASRLGHTPRFKEIVGWQLTIERFGGWREALERAGLSPVENCPVTKLPRIIQETEKQKEIYRRKILEKKRKNIQRMHESTMKRKRK